MLFKFNFSCVRWFLKHVTSCALGGHDPYRKQWCKPQLEDKHEVYYEQGSLHDGCWAPKVGVKQGRLVSECSAWHAISISRVRTWWLLFKKRANRRDRRPRWLLWNPSTYRSQVQCGIVVGRDLFTSDRMLISWSQRERGQVAVPMKVRVFILDSFIYPWTHLIWYEGVFKDINGGNAHLNLLSCTQLTCCAVTWRVSLEWVREACDKLSRGADLWDTTAVAAAGALRLFTLWSVELPPQLSFESICPHARMSSCTPHCLDSLRTLNQSLQTNYLLQNVYLEQDICQLVWVQFQFFFLPASFRTYQPNMFQK